MAARGCVHARARGDRREPVSKAMAVKLASTVVCGDVRPTKGAGERRRTSSRKSRSPTRTTPVAYSPMTTRSRPSDAAASARDAYAHRPPSCRGFMLAASTANPWRRSITAVTGIIAGQHVFQTRRISTSSAQPASAEAATSTTAAPRTRGRRAAELEREAGSAAVSAKPGTSGCRSLSDSHATSYGLQYQRQTSESLLFVVPGPLGPARPAGEREARLERRPVGEGADACQGTVFPLSVAGQPPQPRAAQPELNRPLVPSGRSTWAIEAPYLLKAASTLGVEPRRRPRVGAIGLVATARSR
ncbi:hypothetical protein BE17_48650 [Sorangium cellulosum]|uniref:Uncharacterized protein n=1 Tax=Sorangium cellulosum TaxID=56 RepID=A0A150SL82_SORCE|nr:hypothetical protein BE17_48650 [Sorangium cellulosum]